MQAGDRRRHRRSRQGEEAGQGTTGKKITGHKTTGQKTTGKKTTGHKTTGQKTIGKKEIGRAYLHDRGGVLGIYTLFLLLFFIVCYLYRLPVEAVFYWAALCLVAAVPICAADFWRYAVTCRALRRMDELREIKAGTAIEREYQRLLGLAADDRKRLEGELEVKRGELLDYYTMWVHQIKTPISAMHLLLQSEENSQGGELSEQLFRIEEYVNMALQYLRLDGETDLVIAVCDLDAIVRQAVRKYARVFVKKKLTLTYRPLHCRVLTDEKWLTFAVEQLLSNAVKYTKEGGVSIYLDPDREKTLVISDTGIGIAAEDQPRIFEKGFTGYNGREDKKATGLGLYLCRRALSMLSHTVEVESEPGAGTKMKINLASEDLTVE